MHVVIFLFNIENWEIIIKKYGQTKRREVCVFTTIENQTTTVVKKDRQLLQCRNMIKKNGNK